MDPSVIIQTVFAILESFGFTSPRDVLAIMKSTKTYISGSVALLSLHPDTFAPNDIDFYVSSQGGQQFVEYVISLGFYQMPFTSSTYNTGCIDKSIRFQKPSIPHTLSSPHTINIIFSRTSCALQPIMEFHSTLLMNFIAWYGVVSLYPELTMNKTGFANVIHFLTCLDFQKYRNRGFYIKDDFLETEDDEEGHVCGSHPYCPRTIRYLHDGHALVYHFPNHTRAGKLGFFREKFLAWKLYGGICNELPHVQDDDDINYGFSMNNKLEVGRFFCTNICLFYSTNVNFLSAIHEENFYDVNE